MMINPIIGFLISLIDLYSMGLMFLIVLDLLVQFDIVNKHNNFVNKISFSLNRLYNPILDYIRKYMPNLGFLDLSPLVLILGINFIKNIVLYYFV